MPIAGLLEKSFGSRPTVFIGCLIFSAGVFLTSFAIELSFYAVLFTYGLMFGGGIGIAYPVAISCAVKWFPNHKATVSGAIVMGFGAATLIFSIVQTKIINPDNLNPDFTDETSAAQKYFTQASILERVPLCFWIMSGIYTMIQIIGILLINAPPDTATVSVREDGDDEESRLVQREAAPLATALSSVENSTVVSRTESRTVLVRSRWKC